MYIFEWKCLTAADCSNFDNSVQRIKTWSSERPATAPSTTPNTPAMGSTANLVGLGLTMTAVSTPGVVAEGSTGATQARLSSGQKKRIKSWMKRCRQNPRHSQLNLEGYLLLPVQRVPRYRLLVSSHFDDQFAKADHFRSLRSFSGVLRLQAVVSSKIHLTGRSSRFLPWLRT